MMASSTPMTVPSGQIAIRVKGGSQCSIHRNKEVILHCTDCDILICISCSISIHNGHTLAEISDITPVKKDVLRDFINDTENHKLDQIRKEIQSIETKLSENDTIFLKLGQQIQQQAEVCKNKIDVLTGEFVSLCEKMEKDNQKLLVKYKHELKQRYKSLVKQLKECKEVLQSGSSIDVFDKTSELSSVALQLPVKPVLSEVEFQPCASPTKRLRKALGELYKLSPGTPSNATIDDPTVGDEFLDQPTVLTEFKSPMECTALCPTPFGTWLSEAESKVLLLVDFQGQIRQKVKHSCDITNISTSRKTDNMWFCCAGNKTIYEVASCSNTPVAVFETESCPTCLCINKDEQVVVWTKDPDFLHERVFIFTTAGKVIVSTCPLGQEAWPVRTPFTIAQCSLTGNLALLCRGSTSDEESRGIISVYNEELTLLFPYTGTDDVSGEPCFVPWTAVYDSKGHLIVGDEQGNKIHLISGTGQHLRTIRFGVQTDNLALGVQSDDVLWLCFYSGGKSGKLGIFGKVVRKLSDSTSDLLKPEIKTIQYYKS
ncbi:uncharacterized protein LOC110451113 [Mizuhopecten yessoensis]|uniref:uncharacterized protein LOC110451113 n=1 Tax=Mizuhopecten yessoensis TaxID=6573 RepID=UPI000B45724A|nr:uncharacterized protein LOC110451113 [Mizuhopecten yessoensis]